MSSDAVFEEFAKGTVQPAFTIMVFVRVLAMLLEDDPIGRPMVPIVAAAARTFGMESLFRNTGIFSFFGRSVHLASLKSDRS